MVLLSSACPLRVAQVHWQPRPDLHAVTVVCKATFVLSPVESPLAEVQEEPLDADRFWDDDPRASLRAACDLAPFKRGVDVLVIGHAHAPHGLPVTSLIARIAVSGVDKSVEVHGDRRWTPDGQLGPAAPFTRMPLRWERAAGGPGTCNAAGAPAGLLAPNLQPTGMVLRRPADPVPPIGLGPIAPGWSERDYHNVAPPDQQLAELAPGERLLLENLHPEHPQLITVLEEVTPRALARRAGVEPEEIGLRCDTLCVDADRGTCALVWRGSLLLRSRDEEVLIFVTAVPPGPDAAPTP